MDALPRRSAGPGGVRGGDLGTYDVVVGCNVTVHDDRIIRFYDRDCHVVGQFAPTGSTLDNAVYMNFDTVKALIQAPVRTEDAARSVKRPLLLTLEATNSFRVSSGYSFRP